MLMDESDKIVNGFVNSQTYREKKYISNHGSAQWKVESWFERDFFSNYHRRSGPGIIIISPRTTEHGRGH